jgi:hypothetical protein
LASQNLKVEQAIGHAGWMRAFGLLVACLIPTLAAAGCTVTRADPPQWFADAGAPLAGGGTIAGPAGKLAFAVFGDARPPDPDATAAYPSAVVQGIFQQASARGAQFMVGTGDYMFASSASAVDAQLQLFTAARAAFGGPVYLTMGNHECNGYTNSNCPALNEHPNVTAFLKLLPAGVSKPFYRVDLDTPKGKAKLLFVAANAWSDEQGQWLQQQLADATAYTFVVRHEPTPRYSSDTAPGVAPSEALIGAAPFTLMLLGHSHEYLHFDAKHVISGNAGAPLSSGQHYGFLMIEQQDDGSLQASEIDEASGNVTDSWRIDAAGNAL